MWDVEEGADERNIEEGGSGLWKKETSRKEDMEKGGIEERSKVNGTSRMRMPRKGGVEEGDVEGERSGKRRC